MIRCVLWDIDGTLLNFKAAEAYAIRKCFEKLALGACTDEMLARYSAINQRYWQAMERGEITKEQVLIGRFREFFAAEGLDAKKAEPFNRLYQYRLGDVAFFEPGGRETVEALRGRVLQCAATNGTAIAQRRKLEVSGLHALLDRFFISDEVGYEKPDSRFFDAVFAALPYGREETLIVGDSLTGDMRGGLNAGIRTVFYNPQRKPVPPEYPVDFVISALREVPAILDFIKT